MDTTEMRSELQEIRRLLIQINARVTGLDLRLRAIEAIGTTGQARGEQVQLASPNQDRESTSDNHDTVYAAQLAPAQPSNETSGSVSLCTKETTELESDKAKGPTQVRSILSKQQRSMLTNEIAHYTSGSPRRRTRVSFAGVLDELFAKASENDPIVPSWMGLPELETSLASTQSRRLHLFANPMKASPHYDTDKLKLAIVASDKDDQRTYKPMLGRFTTGHELHQRVRAKFSIEDNQPLNLAFVRYKMIHDNESHLWGNELRRWPNYLFIVPDNFEQGDLMEIEYIGKGPNINPQQHQ